MNRPMISASRRTTFAWLLLAAVVIAAAVLFAVRGCGNGTRQKALAGKPMQLKAMEYNIEYGGTLVSLKKTEAAIKLADPDVAGIEESYANLPKIAEATGYHYYNSSLQILSKYPIYEPSGGGGLYALIEVQPGYAIVFCNVHLDYVSYGPDGLLNHKPLAGILAKEDEVRTSAFLDQQYRVLPALAPAGLPRVPDRRLQRAVEPRLHGGHRRFAPADHPGRAVASEHQAPVARLPRLPTATPTPTR